ncbi:MAG: hypothetical protein ABI467_02550, partial [Kofleriaceae bacterium]
SACTGTAFAVALGMQLLDLDLDALTRVLGGAGQPNNVCLPGVTYNQNGTVQQSLTAPTPGAIADQNMGKSIEKYNNVYDHYTGLIDNLNGIGGGAAVAGGATPTPDLGF